MFSLLRRVDPLVQIYIGLAVAGMALLWLLYAQFQVYQARDWPSVQGSIVESSSASTRSARRVRYYPIVRYNYEVDGRTYTGARIWLARVDESFDDREIAGFLAHYPVGARVTVHYDPANPSNAALLMEGERGLPIVGIFIGLVLAGFGHWRRSKAVPATPAPFGPR